MGDMIRNVDWQQTTLGPPSSWPASLTTMLTLVLSSKAPMMLCWGPELIQLYNDGYKRILSGFSKHPKALGEPAERCWQEVWPQIKPLVDDAIVNQKASLTENFLFPLEHNGQIEESYWTFGVSPAYDDGVVAGVLVICHETTDLMKGRKEMSLLLEAEQALNEELNATNEELLESNAALVEVNSEIQLVEKRLRESENKYKTLFQQSPLPSWIYDPSGLKILEVNDMAIKHYGYSKEEFLNMTLLDLRRAEDIPQFLAAQNRVRNEKELHLTGVFQHIKKNGEVIRVRVFGHHFDYQGRECVLVVADDITEKEKAMRLLQEKDDRLTAATAIAKLGYWQTDVDGRNTYWSHEVFKIWMHDENVDLDDLDSLLAKIHPGDRDLFAQSRKMSSAMMKDIDVEYRLIMQDGTVKWVHEIAKFVSGRNGKPDIFQGTMQDITSPKLLALSLEESNKRFQYAAKATSQAIWEWDADQPTRFREYGYRELFGHKLCGNVGEVAFWRSKVHTEDYDRIWPMMEAARNDSSVHDWTLEYRFKKANGIYIDIKEKAILLRDEQGKLLKMIGSMHDITRRKHEERHLKLLESVITHTRDAVLVTLATPLDEPGPTIIYANESFTKMTGYSVGELLGNTPRLLQGPASDKKEIAKMSAALRAQQPCEINMINYKKNGEEYWVNISISPVKDDKNKVSHYIAIQRDVTDKKKKEAEFKLFTDDLYKRNQELEQFGYVVSHNLRSPVANIMGIADLLELDKDEPATVEKCAADLKSSIHRLDDVIRDISKILSVKDNSLDVVKEPVSIRDIIAEIIEDLKESLPRFDAQIEYPESASAIISHRAYLYSIFYNLITNAIKYRSDKRPSITINIRKRKKNIVIKFSDNGVGFDLSRHSNDIFQPYKRFHAHVEGKGLGLFLVKSHVEALQGKISLESQPGNGTTFKIHLPV